MAIGFLAFFLIIFLMIIFSAPKRRVRFDFSGDSQPFLFEHFNEPFRSFLLLLVFVKDGRAVLLADVRTLAINLRWVVDFKKESGKIFEGCFGWVKNHLDCLGMTGFAGADILLCWIWFYPAGITYAR